MKANKRHLARFDALQRLGCIASRIAGLGYAAPDIHHLTEGGRRLGHDHTIPLSPWFHRGVAPHGMSQAEAETKWGPSLAKSKRAFTARFGTERELLEQVNTLLRNIRRGEVVL